MRYVCSKCGQFVARILDSRPAVDDRFAVAYCDCSPRRGTFERPVVHAVREDIWKPTTIAQRRAADERRKLMTELERGQFTGKTREEREARAAKAQELLWAPFKQQEAKR